MIKTCFFDDSNNSVTVNAFEQLLNRRKREKLFTGIPQMGAFQKDPRMADTFRPRNA